MYRRWSGGRARDCRSTTRGRYWPGEHVRRETSYPGVTTTGGQRDARSTAGKGRIYRRSGPRGASVRVLLAMSVWAGLSLPTTTRAGAVDDLAFAGRVVELETGKPLAGAAVTVGRSIRGAERGTWPSWTGENTVTTDADGQFRLSFPPEQMAERRLWVRLWIRHPDFIPRKSVKVALAEIIRRRDRGEEPFFATIKLERGVEYTGRVVTPGERPVAGIPYSFENAAWGNTRLAVIVDDAAGVTDDDGRIRLRMPKTHSPRPFHRAATGGPGAIPVCSLSALLGERTLPESQRLDPDRPGPHRAIPRHSALGPGGGYRRPADRRADDPGVPRFRPRPAFGRNRGRRQLLARTASPRELPDLRRGAERDHRHRL